MHYRQISTAELAGENLSNIASAIRRRLAGNVANQGISNSIVAAYLLDAEEAIEEIREWLKENVS